MCCKPKVGKLYRCISTWGSKRAQKGDIVLVLAFEQRSGTELLDKIWLIRKDKVELYLSLESNFKMRFEEIKENEK